MGLYQRILMKRTITKIITSKLKNHRIVIIIGQRQVGKTYELLRLHQTLPNSRYFDFEDTDQVNLFGEPSLATLEAILGNRETEEYLLLDEIQLLPKAGSILKLLHDYFPNIKVIATGSAAFLLLKNIGDSLYGRCIQLEMFPLTPREFIGETDTSFDIAKYKTLYNKAKITAQIENILLYGSLPKVFLSKDNVYRQELLTNYYRSLIFKDVFEIEGIRNPTAFKLLLKLLALQLGSEVNPNELAQQLSISRPTVVEYIDLLEKFKIIYILRSYNTNIRNEIKKNFKVYFADLGIRNAAIGNFLTMNSRNDVGPLFENLVINLFKANISYFDLPLEQYFWRNINQSEVDMVLKNTATNEIIPIEIKLTATKNISKAFINLYQKNISKKFCINRNNFWEFI